MATYSFLDVNVTLVGPGISVNLGNGASVAAEGITIEPMTDQSTLLIGADGNGVHSLSADKSSTVTVRLLKTSPVNRQLAQAYELQTSQLGSASHGANVIQVRNAQTGDYVVLSEVAFARRPALTYAQEAGINEWVFHAIDTTMLLGSV